MRLVASFLACSLLGSVGAHALTISFGGTPTPGQGIVSARNPATVETFDTPPFGEPAGTCGTSLAFGESHDSFDPTYTGPDGIVAVRKGSDPGLELAPTDNISCYAVLNDPTIKSGASEFSVGPISLISSDVITYLGFLWGSPDEYNVLELFTTDIPGNYTRYELPGFGFELTGDEVTAAAGVAPYTDVFINFEFDTSIEEVAYMRISTTNWAFEIDNLSISSLDQVIVAGRPVPASFAVPGSSGRPTPFVVAEPASLALIAGMGGLLFVARRRRAA